MEVESVGQRVKMVREFLGLERSAIAEVFGLSTTSVWRIENDKTELTLDTVRKLASVAKIDLNWLILGEGAPPGRANITEIPGEKSEATVKIPYFTGTIAEVLLNPSATTDRELTVPRSLLHRVECSVAMVAARTDMEPIIRPGYCVGICRCHECIDSPHRLSNLIVAINDGGVPKLRWLEETRRTWTLSAENKESGEAPIVVVKPDAPVILGHVLFWLATQEAPEVDRDL
jgi:transcriptional regulator with XRE-family HTH domain